MEESDVRSLEDIGIQKQTGEFIIHQFTFSFKEYNVAVIKS